MKRSQAWLGLAQLALGFSLSASGCIDADERTLSADGAGSGGGGSSSVAGQSAAGSLATQGGTPTTNGGSSVAEGGDPTPQGADGGTGATAAGAGSEPTAGAGDDGPKVAGNREWALWPMPNTSPDPHPAQYDTTEADVTLDRVTGLMWESAPASTDYKWSDANAHCQALTTGGYTNWRLPTRIELLSIVDYSVAEPAINGAAFPACEKQAYWASTPVPDYPNYYHVVDFDIGYNYADTAGELHFARCVRGEPEEVAPRYTVAEGYVRDHATGLRWEMPAPADETDYDSAVARCEALSSGGGIDWRLPTLKELQTLVDVTKAAPAFDTSVFSDVDDQVDMFWSSTRSVYWEPTHIQWLLQDDNGQPPADSPTALYRSRCVMP